MLKLLEFVVWNNCPNECEFCYLKNKYQSTKNDMINTISLVDKYIQNINYDSSVLLTGGEMFINLDNEVFEKLYKLYEKIFQNNFIKIIYFNTNLIYDPNKYLLKILEIAKKYSSIEKIHFTTSDDLTGRFNDTSRKLFYDNLKLLRREFENLNIIVNTILTKQFCDEIIQGKYNIVDYCDKFKVYVNIIPYIDVNGIEKYLPERDEIVQSLLILKKQNSNWFDGYVDIFTRKRDMKVFEYDHVNNQLKDSTTRFLDCHHPVNFVHCCKEKICFGCILETLK